MTSEPVTLKRWWVGLPTTNTRSEVTNALGQRWDRFKSDTGAVKVGATAFWPLDISLMATGNGALGRGARVAIPLHLVYESRDVRLAPGKPQRWRITIRVEGKK